MDETEKPKRKYVRRSFMGIGKADDEINFAIESASDDAMEENDIEAEDVQIEEVSPIDVVFGVEPTSDSLKAKIIKKLGLNKSMVYKPWKGLDHWECSNPRCRWTTFDRQRARRHACE